MRVREVRYMRYALKAKVRKLGDKIRWNYRVALLCQATPISTCVLV